MSALRARVQNHRLQLDEPTDLPEGAEVLLFPSDEGDDLDDDDREALHEALRASQAEADQGALLDWADVLAELRASRGRA